MSVERRLALQQRFQAIAETPMLLLALAFVALLVAPFVFELSDAADATLDALGWMIWAAFAFELVVNTYLAERRLAYLRAHWFDLAIVILPFLRPLRAARAVRALRIVAVGIRSFTVLRQVLAAHGLQNVLLVALVLVLVCAGAVTYLERDGGGSIHDFPTAVWWAMTTVTTVGYGDTFPITAAGRGVGVLLMVLGISIFGVITASIASFFVRSDRDEYAQEELLAAIRRLETKLDEALRAKDAE